MDEIELLEFELDESTSFQQQLSSIAHITKKLYLLQIFKLMQPVEQELIEKDLNEFKVYLKEWTTHIDAAEKAFQNSIRINCDEFLLDILDKMLPYLKGRIKKVSYYKKSMQIQILM